MRRRPIRTGIAFVALAIPLQGCVLDRVFETHRQLCDASPRQVTVDRSSGSYRVWFDRPTLTRDDVEWLVGQPPTRAEPIAGGVRLAYAATQVGRPAEPGRELVAQLAFRDQGDGPKLIAATAPARLSTVVPRELIDSAIAAICRPEISLAPPGARFDISSIDVSTLPDEERIVSLLGPPSFRNGTAIGYAFCLEPCDPRARPVARVVATFEPDGRPRRAEIDYFRYQLTVDLVGKTATVALRLP